VAPEERARKVTVKQKWTACVIEAAVTKWLLWRGNASVITHFYAHHWHECDVYAVTAAGYAVEVEAKVSVADFKADFEKKAKHEALAKALSYDKNAFFRLGSVPRRYYFAVPENMINTNDVPSYAGLLYIQRYKATRWNKKGVAVTVAKPAPLLRAARKVTASQLQTLSEAYKFHYHTLLQRLAKTQEGSEG